MFPFKYISKLNQISIVFGKAYLVQVGRKRMKTSKEMISMEVKIMVNFEGKGGIWIGKGAQGVLDTVNSILPHLHDTYMSLSFISHLSVTLHFTQFPVYTKKTV